MRGLAIRLVECQFTEAKKRRQSKEDCCCKGNYSSGTQTFRTGFHHLHNLQSFVNTEDTAELLSLSSLMAEANSSGSDRGGLGTSRTGAHTPQVPSLKVGMVLSDERVDFLREQAFCVLRVKTDKWNRFIGAEENQKVILDFLDHIWTNRLLLFTGPGGTLHAGDSQVELNIEVAITNDCFLELFANFRLVFFCYCN